MEINLYNHVTERVRYRRKSQKKKKVKINERTGGRKSMKIVNSSIFRGIQKPRIFTTRNDRWASLTTFLLWQTQLTFFFFAFRFLWRVKTSSLYNPPTEYISCSLCVLTVLFSHFILTATLFSLHLFHHPTIYLHESNMAAINDKFQNVTSLRCHQ